jgi:hypothetical protein
MDALISKIQGTCWELDDRGEPAREVDCPPFRPPGYDGSAPLILTSADLPAAQRLVERPADLSQIETTVPDEVAAARMAACKPCPRRAASGKCTLLGCGCTVSSWTTRPWATCPDGRWP